MPAPNPLDVLRASGIDVQHQTPNPREFHRTVQLIDRCTVDQYALVADVLRSEREVNEAKRLCAVANQAAEQLNEMLQTMVQSVRDFWHLVAIRETEEGPRAVLQMAGRWQELAIHPDCDRQELEELQSWEFVAVNENVVVGAWRDDPALFANAHGEVVSFKNVVDRNAHLIEVTRNGHEDCVVELGRPLWDRELTPHSRLVLQRDDPHRVIAVAAADEAPSQFEIPIANFDVRLDELAGMEDLAVRLIEEIQLRIRRPDLRARFGLKPLRGVLLYSHKPGMGKSKFVSAIARWFYDHSETIGYDVVLYEIKPNETKIVWHGGDAKIIRELWQKIRDRQARPRTRPLIQIVVFDEIDSLGNRGAANERPTSSAQNDALQALLVEMDGLARGESQDGPPSHVISFGMTNRPDMLDSAAARPGRFGDLVLSIPAVTLESAEDVMAVYARGSEMPWSLGGEIRTGVDLNEIRAHILRPALASIFNSDILHYKTDTQRNIDVTAGETMANVHFMDAMNSAKKRAATRCWRNSGVPGVTYDDVVDCLLDSAIGVAQQMEADPQMMIRHLQVKVPVTRVDAVDRRELADHRFLKVHSA